MGAAQEDLRAARLFAHVVDIGAHAVAVAEAFARDQLVAAQQRLGPADLDHQVAVLGALDHAVDDLTHAVLELVVLLLALVFAHPLHNHLLRRLRGDAAEIDRRQRIDDVAAKLDVRLELFRDVDRDLGFLVLHNLHRLGPARQAHIAGLAVDRGADVLLVAVLGTASLLDGLLHRLEHFLALDGFLPRDGIGDQQQFGTGDRGIHDGLLVALSWVGRGGEGLSGIVSGVRRKIILGGGGRDQRVGEYQTRATKAFMRQRHVRAVVQAQLCVFGVGAQHGAEETLAPIHRHIGLGPYRVAGKAVPVLDPGQRPVDPSRADLQVPGAGNGIVHVQHGGNRMADRFAILHGDQPAVRPVRHDLHGGHVAPEHGHAHQLIAEAFQRRDDCGGDPGFEAGMTRLVDFQSTKRRPAKATPRITIGE